MSFGFSVSDFVLLVQLAHKTFRNCKNAGPEYIEISREIRSLHSVLRTLRHEAQKPDSNIFRQDSKLNDELLRTAIGCKDILNNLDGVLGKYESLKPDGEAGVGRKTWQRLRFGSKIEELNNTREKIITYTSSMSVILDTMQLKASSRIETKLEGGFTEMAGQFENMRREIYRMASQARASDKNSSTLSLFSLSTYTDDGKEVWQEFRRELIKKGFKSGSLDRHKHVLQAYMLKLDQSGILDQGHDHLWPPDSPRWAKETYTNTVHSLEHMDSPASTNLEGARVNKHHTHTDLKENGSGIASTTDNTISPPLESDNSEKEPPGGLAQAWMFGSRIALSKQGTASEDQKSENALEGTKIKNFFSPLPAVNTTTQHHHQKKSPLSTPSSDVDPGDPTCEAQRETSFNAISGPLEVFYDTNTNSRPSRLNDLDFASTSTAENAVQRPNTTKRNLPFATRHSLLMSSPGAGSMIPQVVETPTSTRTIPDGLLPHRNRCEGFLPIHHQTKLKMRVFKRVRITEEEPRSDAKLPPGKRGQSILKRPRESFPTNPLFPREGVAPKYIRNGIPRNARWTKIPQRLVCPEALETGRERYEAKDDCFIVLRVLTTEEIQNYRNLTRWIKCE